MLDLLSNVIESNSTLNCSSWRGGWLKHFSNNIWSTLRCLATHLNFTWIWPKCQKKYWIGLERQKNPLAIDTKFCKKKSWRFSKSCAYCGKFSGFQMFVEMCENTHTRVSYCRIREVMQGFCWDAISARLYTKTQFGSSISEKIISLPFLCSISKSRWLRWSLRFWWDWDTLWYLFNSKCLINVSFIYEYNFYPSW